MVGCVRDWLFDASKRTGIPSGSFIWEDYLDFKSKLPTICEGWRLDVNELTFRDNTILVEEWLKLADS